MADGMVRAAQQFINDTYSAKIGMTLTVDGQTGWNTMYALTRALQYELGITALSNNFGPTTLSKLTSKYPTIDEKTTLPRNLCRIIQSALYCKGYDGGNYLSESQTFEGLYGTRVRDSVLKMKTDMGVVSTYPGSGVVPKVFKALLTMDPYVVVNSGSNEIRRVQQWLNGRYIKRADFFIMPCDGHSSRAVAQAMLFAIQYEIGMEDGVANGFFGPGTKTGLKSHPVASGSTGIWVRLFTAAMLLNDRKATFSETYSTALSQEVSNFQSFVGLPATGKGDFSTWASLLVSHGDQDRKGAACDGVTKITAARAAALRAQGIKYVGRYLTNPSRTSLPEKAIQPGELATIKDQDLRCFPIYQTFGRDATDYSYALGRAAGYAAMNAAEDHGFKHDTLIYFAVDFDVLDDEVTSNILPHFKGIQDAMTKAGNPYRIGIYGPRNVCTRAARAGHSVSSFVSDMSYGFSGNYGYPLPTDWSFDQIVTRTIGSGDGKIEIDNVIASGRDTGQNSFNPPRGVLPDTRLDPTIIDAMNDDIGKCMESIGKPDQAVARYWTHSECFQTVVVEHDDLITALSQQYSMRKALIQTSTYWEMRHYDLFDKGKDAAIELGAFKDGSTGIAQIWGNVAILAWNYCIKNGYASGEILDPAKKSDVYAMWKKVQGEEFALRTVALAHIWGAAGKPGGGNPPEGESILRAIALDYVENEIFEIIRRYQGFGDEAMADARCRMALYHVFEKYNGISRNK